MAAIGAIGAIGEAVTAIGGSGAAGAAAKVATTAGETAEGGGAVDSLSEGLANMFGAGQPTQTASAQQPQGPPPVKIGDPQADAQRHANQKLADSWGATLTDGSDGGDAPEQGTIGTTASTQTSPTNPTGAPPKPGAAGATPGATARA